MSWSFPGLVCQNLGISRIQGFCWLQRWGGLICFYICIHMVSPGLFATTLEMKRNMHKYQLSLCRWLFIYPCTTFSLKQKNEMHTCICMYSCVCIFSLLVSYLILIIVYLTYFPQRNNAFQGFHISAQSCVRLLSGKDACQAVLDRTITKWILFTFQPCLFGCKKK